MRDDAIYCEHPNGAEMGYIPFWRHEWLRARDRRTVKALSLAVGALTLALIAAIIIR